MPNSISVVTAEDLKNLKVKNLDEAFIKIPGIYVPRLSGIGSTTSQIAMRGVNAANSTAVMVNGQKINDSYNGLLFLLILWNEWKFFGGRHPVSMGAGQWVVWSILLQKILIKILAV